MLRQLTFVAVIALAAAAFLAAATVCRAEDPAPSSDQQTSPEETKKADKYLGIDWGDDTKKEGQKEDPDAAQPTNKVDLSTTLDDGQKKRLEVIKSAAAKGDELAALAQETLDGKNKQLKPEVSVKQFERAAGIYQKAQRDTENFAKGVTDQDTKLTILREHADTYKRQACDMLCKAGMAALKTGGDNPNGIKTAVQYFKRAYKIDPDYSGVKEGVEAARSAYKDLEAKAALAKQGTTGGGSGEEKTKSYEDDYKQKDYTKQGRERQDY